MTDEQNERLRQIREAAKYGGVKPNDIDFLLSLVDSQVAGPRDFDWALRELADGWINVFEREGPHGFNQNALRVLNSVSDDVATSMRSACIEKVKEFAEEWLDHPETRYGSAEAFAKALMTRLESVTIQEQKS